MLLDAAILSILVGLALGRGRLTRLKDLDLRWPAVFVVAGVVKISLMVLAARGMLAQPAIWKAANVLCYLLILVGLALNRHRWELRVVALGVLLNFVVIAANGGSMPVDRALAVRSGNTELVRLLDSPRYLIHKPVTEKTRLRPLADVIPLPMVLPRPRFFSPGSVGDVFITLGACWLIVSAMGAFGLRQHGPRAPGGKEGVNE